MNQKTLAMNKALGTLRTNKTNIDRQVADKMVAANRLSLTKLGLRFDKVVVRLLGSLRACVEGANPKGKTVLMTITAPVKLPGKTQHELETIIRESLSCKGIIEDRHIRVFQNE